MKIVFSRLLFLSLASLVSACAGRAAKPTTPAPEGRVVEMETLRIVAKHDEAGTYTFESYDAEDLFLRANTHLDAGRCVEAVALYDKLVAEFPSNGYVSAALYNAGLCLAHDARHEDALGRFEKLVSELPTSPDVKHASFQAGHLNVTLQRWDAALANADALLSRTDLETGERLEAMVTRAQACLGKSDLPEARHQATQAISFYRTHPAEQFPDAYFISAAAFVLAETTRLQGESMAFPDTNQDEQRAVLLKRAQLLLDAQREYFDAIRYTDAHWASAAGHRIGSMYDTLWHDLMGAPVPSTLSPGAKELYPQEMAKLIKPLLRHAIRYWELTLMMVERTGVRSEWADKTRADLERTRALMLEQPAGVGGLPAPSTSTPSSAAPAPAPSGPAPGAPATAAPTLASPPVSSATP